MIGRLTSPERRQPRNGQRSSFRSLRLAHEHRALLSRGNGRSRPHRQRWSERILQEIARHSHNVARVGHIILTHYHVDHAGCAADLKEATGATVYAHPADAAYIRGEKPHEGPFPRGVIDGLIAPVWFRRSARYRRMLKAATIDHELADGEQLTIADGLEIIHTPGHTLGHISVLMPSKKLAIRRRRRSQRVRTARARGHYVWPGNR